MTIFSRRSTRPVDSSVGAPPVPRLKSTTASGRPAWIPIDSTWQSTPFTPVDSTEPARPGSPEAESTPVDPPTAQSRPDPGARLDPTPQPDPIPVDSGRDWVVDLGLAVGGIAAIVASFETLKQLAHLVGWGHLDWLLPLTLDSFVITATRVWLSRRTKSKKVKDFARTNAMAAIALSLGGNATFHAIGANAWHPGDQFWLLVVAVSSVPPLAIGLISHLAVLRSQDSVFAAVEQERADRSTRPADPIKSTHQPATESTAESTDGASPAGATRVESTALVPDSTRPNAEPSPVESTGTPEGSTQEVDPLLDQARALDREHRANKGKPIGAEPLRKQLGVGASRARALRDAVHGLHAVGSDLSAVNQ